MIMLLRISDMMHKPQGCKYCLDFLYILAQRHINPTQKALNFHNFFSQFAEVD